MIVPEVFLPEEGRSLREGDREQEITYATMAQFPVPVGTDDLPNLGEAGKRLRFTVATDRQLVTVNKGPLAEEAHDGFWICEKCGKTVISKEFDVEAAELVHPDCGGRWVAADV